ncbi:MAG: hypothetical protein CM15mP49_09520 [Actinomycetota bacterium]|nr:MAG: hypothetical protein CM15mP49_09520 [Actinomycetota bacterium]
MGYSLYDTLVVFDKVRDNEHMLSNSKLTYTSVVEKGAQSGIYAVRKYQYHFYSAGCFGFGCWVWHHGGSYFKRISLWHYLSVNNRNLSSLSLPLLQRRSCEINLVMRTQIAIGPTG